MKTNAKWYKWEVLVLLWVAYLLNQGDRQVFNSVLPLIRDSLSLTDTSVSLIAVFFNLFYAAMVPLGGLVGDRFSRKWVVTLSILFWSVATMFTGLANGVFLLILTRSIATGGGEAFFGPANYSLLGQYHTDTRARAMSIHQTSYYVGVILAGWLAGYIGDHLGWQYAFYIFGGAGVVWAVIMALRLKDYKPEETVVSEPVATLGRVRGRGPLDDGTEDKLACTQAQQTVGGAGASAEAVRTLQSSSGYKPSIWDGFKTVFTTPTALMVTIGFCGFIFVITGYMTWVPTFLQE
ncbi:MAG: MFS transporter, partial [Bacteroidales bacterium]|nr:MFS transporter [Bacteroidales bacterium]